MTASTHGDPRLATRRVPIATLVPDPANPRLHGPENLDGLVASLRRFGQAEPLIVQAGTNRLIAGHGRLTAMKTLGWTECDIIELEVDDFTATGLAIALNRTQEVGAAWDDAVLAQLLVQLRNANGLDGTGFSTAQIDELLAEIGADTPADVNDEGPEPPPVDPVSRTGDLWTLGAHQLLVGDSTKADDVARLMGGQTAVLFATDPPYAIAYTGNDRPIHEGKPSGKDWSSLYNEVDIKDLGVFLDGVFRACLPHVAQHTAIYVWHAHVQYPKLIETFERHGLIGHQQVIWVLCRARHNTHYPESSIIWSASREALRAGPFLRVSYPILRITKDRVPRPLGHGPIQTNDPSARSAGRSRHPPLANSRSLTEDDARVFRLGRSVH